MVGVALLFVSGGTLLLVFSVALFLIRCVAFLFRNIGAHLLRNRLHLGNLDGMAFLFILGGCEGFLYGVTLLARFIPAFLLINSLTAGNTTVHQGHSQQQDRGLKHDEK